MKYILNKYKAEIIVGVIVFSWLLFRDINELRFLTIAKGNRIK